VQAQEENRERIEALSEAIMSLRGQKLQEHVLLKEWLLAVGMLWVNQANPKPWHFYPYGIRPGTPQFVAMVRDCTHAPTRYKIMTLASFNSAVALYNAVGPAARVLSEIFDSAVIGQRFEKTYDLPTLVRNKGIQIWLGRESQLIGCSFKRSINSYQVRLRKLGTNKKAAFHSEHHRRSAGFSQRTDQHGPRSHSQDGAVVVPLSDDAGLR